MANLFLALPVVNGDGSGAAVDVSAMGGKKTILVSGDIRASLNVEVSVSGVNGPYATIASFGRGDVDKMQVKTLDVAAQFMRVTTSGYVRGTGAVAVGADDAGALFAALAVPAADGVGAATDVSALGVLNTLVVSGTWTGGVTIEISQDNVNWSDLANFGPTDAGPVAKTLEFTAQFMRVRRVGSTPSLPGTPVVNVGAANLPSGGGGTGEATVQGLVFQPGGAETGPVVFNAWADLITQLGVIRAAAGYNAPIDIFFDDTFLTCTIPAGSYDMENVHWRVVPQQDGQDVSIAFADGAEALNLSRITGPIGLSWAGASATVPRPLQRDLEHIILRDVFMRANATGGTPFFGDQINNGDVSIDVLENSVWRANGTSPVIDFDPAAGTGGLVLYVDGTSIIEADTVHSGASEEWQLFAGGIVEDQPNFNGTFTGITMKSPRWDVFGPTAGTPTTADWNRLMLINASAGAKVVNLPAITEWSTGMSIAVKETSGAPVSITITPAGADTIDGAATFVISNPFVSVTLVSDGQGNWQVI